MREKNALNSLFDCSPSPSLPSSLQPPSLVYGKAHISTNHLRTQRCKFSGSTADSLSGTNSLLLSFTLIFTAPLAPDVWVSALSD